MIPHGIAVKGRTLAGLVILMAIIYDLIYPFWH
jgi:hypothetical protein